MNEAKCPFCGQTVGTFSGFGGQPVFAYHKHGEKACNGWGKNVAKSMELRAAVLDMLNVIMEQYPELKLREDL